MVGWGVGVHRAYGYLIQVLGKAVFFVNVASIWQMDMTLGLQYQVCCKFTYFLFKVLSYKTGGKLPSVITGDTQLCPWPWAFQRADWLPLRSPFFQGLVPPNAAILKPWLSMGSTVPRAPVSLCAPQPSSLRSWYLQWVAAQLIMWLSSSHVSSLRDALEHFWPLKSVLWPLLPSGPTAVSLQWTQPLLLSALQKISETRNYSLVAGMQLEVGQKGHRMNKHMVSTSYSASYSTVCPCQSFLMHKAIKKTPLREAQGLGAKCPTLAKFATLPWEKAKGLGHRCSLLWVLFGWKAGRLYSCQHMFESWMNSPGCWANLSGTWTLQPSVTLRLFSILTSNP